MELEKIKHPMIFIFGAGSASGKDTVLNSAKNKIKILIAPSTVTRKKRPGEQQGQYNFVSLKEFNSLLKKGLFLEHNKFQGNYYATNIDKILKNTKKAPTIKLIDFKGIRKIKNNPTIKYNYKNNTMILENKFIIKTYFIAIHRASIFYNMRSMYKRDGFHWKSIKRTIILITESIASKKEADYRILNPEKKHEIATEKLIKLIKKIDEECKIWT